MARQQACVRSEQGGTQMYDAVVIGSGFGPNQLFNKWCFEHNLPVSFQLLSPTVLFRSEANHIAIHPDREKTIAQFCAIPEAPVKNIRAFFAHQEKIADILWPIFDDPNRLPPFSIAGLWWHISRCWRYPALLPLINTSLYDLLKKFGLQDFPPLLQYCNALCQITIQTDIKNAEAPFSLCTMDYLFRGTGHIKGGVGTLAMAMVNRIKEMGGEVCMPGRVHQIQETKTGWKIKIRKDEIQTKSIIANVLPADLDKLIPTKELPKTEQKIQERVDAGWGAVMLYLIIKDHPSLPRHPHHIQCVQDATQPLFEGNHIFCSLGGPNENTDPTLRTATVSTHISMERYSAHPDVPKLIESVQNKMKELLKEKVPEVYPHIIEVLPASPRTFARFTKRAQGCVGGIPRTKGWQNYKGLWPKQVYPNLWLVGDSVFPGQSTLSTAVGGYRTANALLRTIP